MLKLSIDPSFSNIHTFTEHQNDPTHSKSQTSQVGSLETGMEVMNHRDWQTALDAGRCEGPELEGAGSLCFLSSALLQGIGSVLREDALPGLHICSCGHCGASARSRIVLSLRDAIWGYVVCNLWSRISTISMDWYKMCTN